MLVLTSSIMYIKKTEKHTAKCYNRNDFNYDYHETGYANKKVIIMKSNRKLQRNHNVFFFLILSEDLKKGYHDSADIKIYD